MEYFKKGDLVTRLTNWNGKGTVRIEHCVVHSAGKKQMYLIGEDGKLHGELFSPIKGRHWGEMIIDRSAEDHSTALEFGNTLAEECIKVGRETPEVRVITTEEARIEIEEKFR